MVDSVNIPKDLTKLFEFKDTSDTLRRFLTDMLLRVETLEKSNTELKAQLEVINGRLN